ncbi:class I SAM-dependent methyltransferase [Pseudomonas mosselii]|uniref:class I SAM-dependent methyltransferase n=1 Tax=Pseudomonas mosselii TaxID=78327 RepID=UPI001F0B2546|nr:class I SAM-dependent methyltransferase [Pseudomonas mosselii]
MGSDMRACEICSGTHLEQLHRQHFLFPGLPRPLHYDVVACRECGFAYASDIPDQSALDQFYQTVEHHLHADLPPGLARVHGDFFRFVQEQAGLANDARILDIGSGMGHFLAHFQQAGFQHLLGMEPSPAAAELARKIYGLEVRSATVDAFVTDERFQLVSLCGVLEHIADLRSSMAKIAALLADDGYLFIAVPDAEAFGKAPPAEPFLEFALEHINFFTAASLDNVLNACGFEKVTVISQHNDFYDNHYLLALYRKTANPAKRVAVDEVAADSLCSYVALSRQVLRPVEELAEQLEASGEPLLIWGAGSLTSRLLCDTRLGSANIVGIVDRNRNLQGKSLLGVTISAPDSVIDQQGVTVFIASTTYAAEIRNTLVEQYGWRGKIVSLASGTR